MGWSVGLEEGSVFSLRPSLDDRQRGGGGGKWANARKAREWMSTRTRVGLITRFRI